MNYRLIAHEIKKKQHQKKAEIVPRESLIPADEKAAMLVEDIRTNFKRHNPQGAKFVMLGGDPSPLQNQIAKYRRESDPDDSKFVNFTEIATRKLRSVMEDESASVGGYLLFVEYTHGDEDYLVIILLSSKARARFDEKLNLTQVSTLDIEHVRHGVRFRLSGIGNNETGAIQIVARASEGNFFKTFADCEINSESKIQSNILRTTLDRWADTEKLDEAGREEVMKGTYSYWKTCKKNGTTMTLEGLANALYPNDPSKFRQFITDEGNELDGEFSPPRTCDMKQFQKFCFSGDGLKIEFDRRKWHDKIAINGNKLIIKNPPNELLEQIRDDKL